MISITDLVHALDKVEERPEPAKYILRWMIIDNLSPKQRKIYNLILRNPGISTPEIGRHFHRTKTETIQNVVARLLELKAVKRKRMYGNYNAWFVRFKPNGESA